MHKTVVTTVQRSNKIVTTKDTKQVGAVTSVERGTLVTLCVAVNAINLFDPTYADIPQEGI